MSSFIVFSISISKLLRTVALVINLVRCRAFGDVFVLIHFLITNSNSSSSSIKLCRCYTTTTTTTTTTNTTTTSSSSSSSSTVVVVADYAELQLKLFPITYMVQLKELNKQKLKLSRCDPSCRLIRRGL